jgi:hypothetical protein
MNSNEARCARWDDCARPARIQSERPVAQAHR